MQLTCTLPEPSSSRALSSARDDDECTILASQLFDPYTKQLVKDQHIRVSKASGLILDVRTFTDEDLAILDLTNPDVLDLRGLTVLPGLVDVHVHLFLRPYSEISWDDQLTKESLPERTVRATVHAKRTLMAGFTSVRDLGTEGAEDADVALRKCLSGPTPLIPGPRYFCANRAIVSSGAYGPKSMVHPHQEGVDGIYGAEVADGEVECAKAVRRQISAGADVIKIYADYRFRSRMTSVSPATSAMSTPLFNQAELRAMFNAAAQHGVKVASHSYTKSSVHNLLTLGAWSIEHAFYDSFLEHPLGHLPFSGQTTWVPTLSVYWASRSGAGGQKRWETAAASFKQALAAGVERVATGGDTGTFPHGDNALELQLMVRLGAPWATVLRWATLGGWECIRSMGWEGPEGKARLERAECLEGGGEDPRVVGDNEVPFGAVRKGWAADIIALKGDVEKDFENAARKDAVKFVMKGGRVFKRDGNEVPCM